MSGPANAPAAPPAPAPTPAAPSALKAWLSAARPKTLTVSVAPVAVATALAHAQGAARPLAALVALLGALLIQVGTNLHNDAADFRRGADDEDRIGPARATQQGWLTEGQVQGAAYAAFALSALLGVYLVYLAGWPLLAVGLVSIACGLAYTGGPFPLAYLGVADLFVLVFFGLVATGGAYYVQALSLPPQALIAGLPLGLLATAILAVNNLRDRVGDARVGKKTLAVRFGERGARLEYTLCVLGAFAVPPIAVAAGAAPRGWLLSLVALPLGLWQVRKLWRLDGPELNPELGATGRLELVYALLLSGGALL